MKKGIIIGVVALILGIGIGSQINKTEIDKPADTLASASTQTPVPTETATPEPTQEADKYVELEKKSYMAGKYLVGTDLPEGEYVIVISDYKEGYYCLASDENFKNIVMENMFEKGDTITIRNGEYIKITDAVLVPIDEFLATYDALTPSMCGFTYKVGDMLTAGKYEIAPLAAETGVYTIYDSSRKDNIIETKEFEYNVTVEVKDGQYLETDKCFITDKK